MKSFKRVLFSKVSKSKRVQNKFAVISNVVSLLPVSDFVIILKLFLENNFPDIKKNISWKYIKRLKVENYEIVLLLVCIPINNNIEYF